MSLSVSHDKCNGFEDESVLYKHPLENTWTLWYFKNDSKEWLSNLCEIYSFDTVEDFWCVFNHIKVPNELKLGTDYYLFKKGIRPMWEDPSNKDGGRWLITIEKKHGENKVDDYWLELILLMIGENFGDYNRDICGISVNVRPKADKIYLWTSDASEANIEGIKAIGQIVKDELRIPSANKINYQSHFDATRKTYSSKNICRL